MRVLGYLRVSTEEQANSGLSLTAQKERIEKEADYRGWELVAIYKDAAVSGKAKVKPEREKALSLLASGDAEALVVAKLDRISRSVVDFGRLLADAERQGWAFVAIDPGVDTSKANGKLVANVLMSVAQWEAEIISERTSAALAVMKSQGTRLGRPRQTPDSVLRRVVRLRNKGLSIAAIAEDLNRRQVPTPRGGSQWWTSTVRGLLRSAALDREVA